MYANFFTAYNPFWHLLNLGELNCGITKDSYRLRNIFCLCNSARMVGLFEHVISASQSAESNDCLMVRNWSWILLRSTSVKLVLANRTATDKYSCAFDVILYPFIHHRNMSNLGATSCVPSRNHRPRCLCPGNRMHPCRECRISHHLFLR